MARFRSRLLLLPVLGLLAPAAPSAAQGGALNPDVQRRIDAVMPSVVNWRRDIHQHPELGNREVRTARLVADHLRKLGMEVQTGVAHTGVVAVLKGGRPGPVVALRADMDALPVTEQVDVPFASRQTGEYNGQQVGIMHACGHDNHVAILMGTAQVLAGMRGQLAGTVKFIFQPAEEGPPPGEEGGASLMVREGVLDGPVKPEAIFGLHVGVVPEHVGKILYRPAGTMASADEMRIVVRGRQSHGAAPWAGVDPVVVSAQIVSALQTIASRQINVTTAPAVVTIGSINGGVRYNIIPDSVVMTGTVRTFDPQMQKDIHQRIRRTAEMIAQSAGATAEVWIRTNAPVTYNDPALTERMVPTLHRVAGANQVAVAPLVTGAEDFAFFQEKIPGFYFFLPSVPLGRDPLTAPGNHSPHYFVDEGVLPLGVRAMTQLTLDYLSGR